MFRVRHEPCPVAEALDTQVILSLKSSSTIRRGSRAISAPSLNGKSDVWSHDQLHLYSSYPEKIVTPEGKLLARMSLTPKGKKSSRRARGKAGEGGAMAILTWFLVLLPTS